MTKKLLYAIILAVAPICASAVIAYPDPIEICQPDGSKLTIILSGDEFHHIYRTLDGLMILPDSEGFFRYAELDINGRISPLGEIAQDNIAPKTLDLIKSNQSGLIGIAERERSKAINARPKSYHSGNTIKKNLNLLKAAEGEKPELGIGLCDKAFPAYGEQKAIVILVEYQDVRFGIEKANDYFSRMLNEEDFYLYNGTGSARDFFIKNSNGIFKPQFDVFGPVLLKGTRKEYGANNSWGQDCYPEGMVIEACQQLDATVNFSEYDRDGDGYIDNVFLFYAGGGEHDTGGGADSVWPHASSIANWNSRPYIFDGVRLDSYGCTCESPRSFNGPDGIGTFVHEFSHVMGLPDLYTTDYNDAYTPGAYSTLDRGSYNDRGRTPPNYSSFERAALGWMKPTSFGEDGWYTLPELNESNFAYIIQSDDPNEFLLLENRQKKGNDSHIPGHGMLVWRIDYDHDIWERNEVNNDPLRQRVDLIEADGPDGIVRMAHPFPGSKKVTEFGFDTTPALDFRNGTKTMIQITDISEIDGTIGFSFSTDGNGGAEIKKTELLINTNIMVNGNTVTSQNEIEIFTASGLNISGKLAPGSSFPLPQSGLYIIRSGSESIKVRI